MSEGKEGKSAEKSKGASIYSIVSAQAGGVSDAFLRVTAGQKLDTFKEAVDPYLKISEDLAVNSVKWTLKQAYENARAYLVRDSKDLIDSWKAGLGLQVGTAFMGLQETYWGTPQLVSMLVNQRLDVSIRPKLERYFNSLYTPNIPDTRLAFQMLMEGQISRAEFNQNLLELGWSSAWAPKVYEALNREPDIYTAFSMYKRGLITLAQLYADFKVNGYDDTWHAKLVQALHRRPSFRELTALSDFYVMPDLWVTEVLRANGYSDGDILYILPALQLRPLREEVRSVVGRYLWQYQIGRITLAELTTGLKALKLLPKEIELDVLWAELRYADQLIDDQLEILEARVQYGDPDMQTEDEIFAELVALGICEERSNLLAELWYYKYVYVPP
jgi:hypothetical protein